MMDSAFTIDFTKLLTQILFVGSYINNFIVKGLVALGVPLSASQVQVLLAIIYMTGILLVIHFIEITKKPLKIGIIAGLCLLILGFFKTT